MTLAVALLSAVSVQAQPYYLYTLVDLGTLGGESSRADAINNIGWIAGQADTKDGASRAFLWKGEGALLDLGSLGGGISQAHGLNDAGMVVGESLDAAQRTAAFIWSDLGGLRALPLPPDSVYSAALAVNERGQAVGTVEDAGGSHAVRWDGDAVAVLPRFPGPGYIQPLDVNGRGDVVGQIQTGPESTELPPSLAFLFAGALEARNLAAFKLLTPHSGSAAVAVNNRGVAAGYLMLDSSRVRAARFAVDTEPVLPPDGQAAYSSVTDLNDHGDLVGSFIPSFFADETACVWREGRMINLNEATEKDDAWFLVQATGINDRGEICGYGLKGELNRAFLLRPVADARVADWPDLVFTVADGGVEHDDRAAVLSVESRGRVDIKRIVFFVDGMELGSVEEPPYEWGWQGPAAASPIFHAVVHDTRGRRFSTPHSVLPALSDK